MFKLISMLIAAIPLFLFVRAVVGRSTAMKKAVSDLRRQIDYLIWVMLIAIAVGIVYSVVTLIQPLWR